jgi:hypothetical protein
MSTDTGVRAAVEVLAKALAARPDAVRVTETRQQQATLIEVFASPEDMGRILGRVGKTAAALRTLASMAGEREGRTVTLELRESR